MRFYGKSCSFFRNTVSHFPLYKARLEGWIDFTANVLKRAFAQRRVIAPIRSIIAGAFLMSFIVASGIFFYEFLGTF